MTDDIVTRLRDTAYETDVCWEAAAEIERLRADLENVRDINWKLEEELQTHYREYDPDSDVEPYDEY